MFGIIGRREMFKLMKGESVLLSVSDIVNSIVSLVEAHEVLSEIEFSDVKRIYDKYNAMKTKSLVDYDMYKTIGLSIMDDFENIVPFELICGDKSKKKDGEEKKKWIENEAEKIADERVKEVEKFCALFKKYNIDIDLELFVLCSPTYYGAMHIQTANRKDASGLYKNMITYAYGIGSLKIANLLDLTKVEFSPSACGEEMIKRHKKAYDENSTFDGYKKDFTVSFLNLCELHTSEDNWEAIMDRFFYYFDHIDMPLSLVANYKRGK